MTFYDYTNLAIVVFGVFATGLSTWLGILFWRLKAELATPLAVMCFTGALAGVATLVFSLSSLFGLYAQMHPFVVDLLRLLIFGGLTGSDLYMWKKVKAISDG